MFIALLLSFIAKLASTAFLDSVPRLLLPWFTERKRALPWRSGHGVWGIWVSEVMLQQTRVEAVIPFFDKFMNRFADVATFAEAEIEDVLPYWAGLGYYRRVRMLHEAARFVVNELNGELPQNSESLQSLPGVGPYTAAAIASLAYGERVPVVDGNVKRVVARLLGLNLAMSDRALHQEAEKCGRRWMSALGADEAPGALNEAVMELGATICRPRSAGCGGCVLRKGCIAFAEGCVESVPLPNKKKKWVDLDLAFFVAEKDGKYALLKRTEGWNIGLFEPPSVVVQPGVEASASWEEWGQSGATISPLEGVVSHTITKHKIRAKVYCVGVAEEALSGLSWYEPGEVPLTGLASKVLKLVASS